MGVQGRFEGHGIQSGKVPVGLEGVGFVVMHEVLRHFVDDLAQHELHILELGEDMDPAVVVDLDGDRQSYKARRIVDVEVKDHAFVLVVVLSHHLFNAVGGRDPGPDLGVRDALAPVLLHLEELEALGGVERLDGELTEQHDSRRLQVTEGLLEHGPAGVHLGVGRCPALLLLVVRDAVHRVDPPAVALQVYPQVAQGSFEKVMVAALFPPARVVLLR